MRVRALLLAGATCGILAACSKPAEAPSEANAPPAPMTSSIQPGLYRTTATVLEMNIPGMSMQQMNMAPVTSEECVTEADVADFTNNSMTQANEGETCTQTAMTAAGGRIEGESSCAGGPGGARTMHISGTYTATGVDMEISGASQMPGGAGEMTQRIHIVSERTGDCPAGSE